jgi:perosamine synthetase
MIPIMEPWLDEEETARVVDCLKSGWISSQGKYIPEFEEAFAAFCGSRYGVATSNGTTALHLALLTLGIGPGDEVIVPALSFIATANVVVYTGARPVFADVDEETWTLDPDQLPALINERTKAVIPVHLYGHPAHMEPILAVARRHGLWVIEDAAEAHGAEYRGKKVGALGDMGCFSFYGNKIISTGEGGMLVTDNPEWAEKARILRDHGMSRKKKYWHPVIGYNFRMTNLQAAIGLGQMQKLQRLIEIKRDLADRYRKGLDGREGLRIQGEAPWAKSVFWLFSLVFGSARGKTRDELIAYLSRFGVETRPVFYPIPEMPPYGGAGNFPKAVAISREGISLPSGYRLKPEEQQRIIDLILDFHRGTEGP